VTPRISSKVCIRWHLAGMHTSFLFQRHALPTHYPRTTHALPMHYPCTTHALPMHYPCISQYTRSWANRPLVKLLATVATGVAAPVSWLTGFLSTRWLLVKPVGLDGCCSRLGSSSVAVLETTSDPMLELVCNLVSSIHAAHWT
jgi:hypothetical protein